eukprot:2047800-Rhodomonas_salina.2
MIASDGIRSDDLNKAQLLAAFDSPEHGSFLARSEKLQLFVRTSSVQSRMSLSQFQDAVQELFSDHYRAFFESLKIPEKLCASVLAAAKRYPGSSNQLACESKAQFPLQSVALLPKEQRVAIARELLAKTSEVMVEEIAEGFGQAASYEQFRTSFG